MSNTRLFEEFYNEVFKRRLENLGLTVLLRESRGEPQFLIVLKELSLDLAGQKWGKDEL